MNTPTPTAEHVKEAVQLLTDFVDGNLLELSLREYNMRHADGDYLSPDDIRCVDRIATVLALRDTRYAVKEAECEKLRRALEPFADESKWKRCYSPETDLSLWTIMDYTTNPKCPAIAAQQALTDTLTEQTK